MSPFIQRMMLREVDYYKWMYMDRRAREILYEIAASIDAPPKPLSRKRLKQLRRKEVSAHDTAKRQQQQFA